VSISPATVLHISTATAFRAPDAGGCSGVVDTGEYDGAGKFAGVGGGSGLGGNRGGPSGGGGGGIDPFGMAGHYVIGRSMGGLVIGASIGTSGRPVVGHRDRVGSIRLTNCQP